jgi:hypothetical protein
MYFMYLQLYMEYSLECLQYNPCMHEHVLCEEVNNLMYNKRTCTVQRL